MNFNLTDEQKAIRETVRKFAHGEVAPRAEELDRSGEFPYDLVKRCAEIGIIGLLFPEEMGGSGADTISWILAVEELARGDMSLAVTIFVSTINGYGLYEGGSEELKQRFIPPLLKGEALGALGLTEPNAGSDNQSIQTTARLDGDEFVINGAKCFITNPGTEISSFVNVVAVLGQRSDGRKEFGNIVVPCDTPGFRVSKPYRKMGWRSSDTRELYFEDCRVPRAYQLKPRIPGLGATLLLLSLGRISLAASAIGLAQACLDHSLKYARERVQFGRPISSFQRVQDMLVDMHVEIEAARLLNLKAAFLRDQGQEQAAFNAASVAKLYGTEAGKRCADLAVQVHGGYGYMDEFPVSRYYRDIRIATIGDGTSEIQRMLIARSLGC